MNLETITDMQSWCRTWETQRSLQEFLEPDRKPKVIYTDNSLEFGKACEDLSWNHCTSTQHRLETNGIAERAVRRVKEGTSGVLLQSGLDENWWADSMDCYCYLRNIQDLRAVRRAKEGISAVLLQSGLNESWWAGSMECYTYLREIRDLLSDGKTPYERRFGQPFKGPIISFGLLVECHHFTAKDQSKNPSIWKESLTWIVPRIRIVRGVNLER